MRAALFLVAVVGLLFAFVYPTRTFLDQRAATGKARAQLELLQSENARMAREAKKLSTDSEIEKLAREKYGLVKPGERAVRGPARAHHDDGCPERVDHTARSVAVAS